MKGKHAKNTANKQKLAKRMLALCFAVVFLCSCVLPVFATGSSLLTDALREAVEETAASTDATTEAGGGTMMDSFQTMMSSYTTEYKTTYRFWLSEKDSYYLPDAEKTSASDLEGYDNFYAVAAIENNTTLTAPEGFQNPTDPTGAGRKFEGWYYIDTYGVTQTFTFDDSPVLLDKSATVDVFAQWSEAPAADPADDADKAEGDTKADDTVKDDTKADDTKAGDTATGDETASDDETVADDVDDTLDEDAGEVDPADEEVLDIQTVTASAPARAAARAPANYEITLVDTVKANGRYSIKVTQNGKDVTDSFLSGATVTWTRNGTTVNRVIKSIGGKQVSNLAQNGAWLNVAYDLDEIGGTSTATQYTVTIKDQSGSTISTQSATLNLNTSLLNGSFEEPVITGDNYDKSGHPHIPAGDVPAWQTTEKNGNIEIGNVTVYKNVEKTKWVEGHWEGGWWVPGHNETYTEKEYYTAKNYNVSDAKDGQQFAELNAGSESSLYQDVLTTPGATMYWGLSHRARYANASDTMYLVIAPTNLVDGLKNHSDLKTLVEGLSDGWNYNVKYNGKTGAVYKNTITDSNAAWGTYNGSITVPSGQFATRFFFVSGPTSTGNATLGNFLDNVWFSQETQPLPSGTAMVSVTKNIYGLTLEEVQQNLSRKEFINGTATSGTVGNITFDRTEWNQATDAQGNGYVTATKEIKVTDILADWSNTYTFTENTAQAQVDGYAMTADDETKSVTVGYDNNRGKVTFTNRYTKSTADFTIKKLVTGNLGDLTRKFNFTITVKDKNGIDASFVLNNDTKSGTASFELGNNESISLTKVPVGATVTIAETDADDYTVTATLGGTEINPEGTNTFKFTVTQAEASGTTSDDVGEQALMLASYDEDLEVDPTATGTEVVITNYKNLDEIPTGVILDTLPYVLMLIAVGGGVVAFFLRKRHHDDEE